MYGSTVSITLTNFNNGIGGNGGCIFSISSSLSITSSNFNGNVALSFGGGVYTISNTLTTITSTTFTNNQALMGDAIRIEESEGSDSITSCTFNSNTNPSFIHFLKAVVTVDGWTFQQLAGNDPSTLSSTVLSSLRRGSAIACEAESKAVIKNSNFKNILTSNGVVSISEINRASTQSSVQYTISSNTFQNNIAYSSYGGGAIYLSNPINVNIQSNTFSSNNAMNADGGAIKFTWENSKWVASISSNTFSLNIAKSKGGAISWDQVEPSNILSNVYTNNKATIYGNNIGSLGEYIVVISQSDYKSNYNTIGDIAPVPLNIRRKLKRKLTTYTVSDHQSGQALQTLYIGIVDRYGYIVKYGNTNRIETKAKNKASDKYIASVTGTTSFLPSNGWAVVDGLILTATPNTTQTIQFFSKDLRSISNTLDLLVKCRSWKAGEEYTSIGA